MSNNLPLPSLNDPIAGNGGKVTKAWSYWFQGFSAPPAAFDDTVGTSPLDFTAPADGSFLVTGGTGVAVTLTRGGVSVVVPASGFIPMTMGDSLVVTWATPPTMNFIPA